MLISFGFTWSVGLGLPALVRYVLYRRALEKSEALYWACGLGVAELILFTLLGSQSKTHSVLLLIGIVAFRIMVARGPFDRQVAPEATAKRTAPIEQSQTNVLASTVAPHPGAGLHLGWRRLWTVVAVCWLVVIGSRLAYELAGESAEMYVANKREVPSDFRDYDFDRYEVYLKAQLKPDTQADAPLEANATKGERFAAEFAQFWRTGNKEVNGRLERLLEGFDLPRLSPEAEAALATELMIPKQSVYNSEMVARRYLQVRELRQSMRASPILRDQVMGVKPSIYSVNLPATLFALFGPPLLILLVWSVFRWVRRGFVA